ncbi:MAG: cyclic nucleotide-binding domain-containing protein [Ignavibacteriales bacterium]|nr:cyclic nucleotide-binding domain-containing protein [Ignavibacteriales bacterium]
MRGWHTARLGRCSRPTRWCSGRGTWNRICFICKYGSLKVLKVSPDGREQVLRFIDAGEIFNEIGILAKKPSPATAMALEESGIWLLPRYTLEEIVLAHPQVSNADHRKYGGQDHQPGHTRRGPVTEDRRGALCPTFAGASRGGCDRTPPLDEPDRTCVTPWHRAGRVEPRHPRVDEGGADRDGLNSTSAFWIVRGWRSGR